jgi:hypothetical protein
MAAVRLDDRMAIHTRVEARAYADNQIRRLHAELGRGFPHSRINDGVRVKPMAGFGIGIHEQGYVPKVHNFGKPRESFRKPAPQIFNHHFPGIGGFSQSDQTSDSPGLRNLGYNKRNTTPVQARGDAGS